MKKFFAILLGIVDVFCVGLIFYLMLSNLSGTSKAPIPFHSIVSPS